MTDSKQKMHYAWIVFISCILLKLGLGGAVNSIAGNFVTPVVEELGCQVSQFTMLVSVEALAMALLYTTAAKMLTTKKIGIVMGIAALAECIGIALMATYHDVRLFYLSGAIIGIGVAFTGFVAIPIVVNMWFRKKAGTVLGIIVAAEGLSAVLYNLITGSLIVNFGWRASYLIVAIICLILSVPPVFLFIKSPEEVGVEPYGADSTESEETVQEEVWGLTRKEALHSPILYITWAACMLYSVGCGVQQYIATFATMELGQSITFGANAMMIFSIGLVASSTILGWINDKFGVKAGLLWGAFFITVGYIVMIMSIQNPNLVMLASALVGLGGSMYTVQCPLLARTALGNKDYSSIWSLMMTGNSLIGAASFSRIGLFYDIGGTYRGAFIMAIVLYILAFFVGAFAISLSKKTIQKN